MIESLSPNLLVDNMDKSIEFYTGVLGFEKVMSVPEEAPFVWVMLKMGGVSMMLQERESFVKEVPELKEVKGAAMTFYLVVKGLKTYYEKASKESILRDWNTTFYGKNEFTVIDPDGFFITLAEDA